ncbi:histone deacetylase hda2 [Aphelenchoides avenae]|nr:histone deacetylase hda2 [Aphelenchus avenae]
MSDAAAAVENLPEAQEGEAGVFAVIPNTDCPHLEKVGAVPEEGISVATPCSVCSAGEENWVCLTCYKVHCGRYVNQHAMAHFEAEGHPLAVSFADISAWCYECNAYIHNDALKAAKNAVHRSKFGEGIPAESQ